MSNHDELMQFVDRSYCLLKGFPNLFLIKDLNSLCVGFSDSLSCMLNMEKKSSIVNHNSVTNYYIDDYDEKLKLTQREEECLFLLVRGKSAKAIGKLLSISSRTVEVYINNIKQKMSVSSRNEIIDKAIELGILDIIPKKAINRLIKNPANWPFPNW